MDLMVVYPDGSAGRPDLTVALDIATRTPLAAILRPEATKSVDAAVLLARALTPLPMQPGWDASIAFTRSLLPPGMVRDDEETRTNLAAKPLIVPESITIDRGKVFVGSTFMAACERLQISVTKAAPRTPTDKPHIERFFAGVNSGFTQYLAGYVGANVVRRGQNPASEAYWTLAQVQDLLDLWLAAVWQNRPHSGLRLPAMPRKDLTPNEMFAALHGVAPTITVGFSRDDYISLLPVAYRSIQPYGVNFESLHYDSARLHPLRGINSGLPEPARNRWEIRYDPYRLQSIFVRDHPKGVWIEAEWTLAQKTLAPFSLDVLRSARKALELRGTTAPGINVLAEINRIQSSGAATTKERKAARRNTTTDPVVPALTVALEPADAPEPETRHPPAVRPHDASTKTRSSSGST